jgi:hypothetical protein
LSADQYQSTKNSQIRRADYLWFDEVVNLDIVTIRQRPKSRTRFGEGGRDASTFDRNVRLRATLRIWARDTKLFLIKVLLFLLFGILYCYILYIGHTLYQKNVGEALV